MGLYDLFSTDENIEQDGFELVLYDANAEIKFLLARAGGSNKKFGNRIQALSRPVQYQIDKNTLPEEKSIDIMAQAIAETVILDWEGVTDREGKTLPFSVANAKQLLIDLPELRGIIMEEATRAANFIKAEQEEAAGKYETTSDGA